jgi:hypothetical protein
MNTLESTAFMQLVSCVVYALDRPFAEAGFEGLPGGDGVKLGGDWFNRYLDAGSIGKLQSLIRSQHTVDNRCGDLGCHGVFLSSYTGCCSFAI